MIEQELKDALGKNIKFFRFRRQFSQANLAEKADISVTFLSNIERGNNFPQAGTLCNLAQALNVEVWELFRAKVLLMINFPLLTAFRKTLPSMLILLWKPFISSIRPDFNDRLDEFLSSA
ncbi:MAG: helix-turn-helix domain-containing protein [Treponema sp.]|jgi:transcriptional regulator with XRE-family HTH domain|nr:helix-turn-helix domain-containing protein [Treponema sp.]